MKLDELIKEWDWARGLTVELLKACSNQDLVFQLHQSSGALWKQFRHIGRVHENYLHALDTHKMMFGVEGCLYSGGSSKDSLLSYFQNLQERHTLALNSFEPDIEIDWFGDKTSTEIHLVRLLSHETLHHGQLILHWRVLGHDFPDAWSSWGE